MSNQEQEHMEIELQKSKAGRKRGLGIILMKKELKRRSCWMQMQILSMDHGLKIVKKLQ